MPQTFDVKFLPLSEATIQQTRKRYGRLVTLYNWLWFPWAALSLFAGYEVFNLYLSDTEGFELLKPVMGVLAGALTAIVMQTPASHYGLYVHKVRQTFSPLPQSKCQTALLLARSHPELETYRMAVAAERQFTLGDLEAMQSYVAEKAKLKEKKEAEDIHQAACAALHRAS